LPRRHRRDRRRGFAVALPATLVAFQRAPGDAPARERLAVDLTTLKDDAKPSATRS
jgi:hypothetical protein